VLKPWAFAGGDKGSGVARGQVGARALGCRPWVRSSTLFAVILNVFLSRNLDQCMLKTRIFGEKL